MMKILKVEIIQKVTVTEGNNKLPQTGSPISSSQVVFIALVITAIGIVALKKKENIV